MADKDVRNFDPQTGKGMTPAQTADAAAAGAQPGYSAPDRSHPSAAAQPKMPVNTKPIAPRTYGAPVGNVILK